ncbi:MAG: glycine--tRNA ligase subunit alpha [Terriglobia bacterium]
MKRRRRSRATGSSRGLPLQEVILALSRFWAARACVIQQPYDLEVGAGTMHPETFLRVLGPDPYRVAYVQPSRRPVDGRYGENPNRLYKHLQFQVILKPVPADIQEVFLGSLTALGIELRQHDIRFEEDNWEAPTLGAWGIGWQVMLDGIEITQFTYFQQCGGLDLDPVAVELTYGLERIGLYLQNASNVFELAWNDRMNYGQLRLEEERQFSAYCFDFADVATCRKLFELQEAEARRLLSRYPKDTEAEEKRSFPLLAVYDLCLKCSHLFNLLDSRGAISTTERAALIARIRSLTCQVASLYLDQKCALGPST